MDVGTPAVFCEDHGWALICGIAFGLIAGILSSLVAGAVAGEEQIPHRAPDGYALLRVFVGRAGQEAELPWDEAGLLDIAREELRLTLGITADPVLIRIFRWEKAMPQYNLGHPERLARIDEALATLPGLGLAGNGYAGIGIPDCIRSGELAVERVLENRTQMAQI